MVDGACVYIWVKQTVFKTCQVVAIAESQLHLFAEPGDEVVSIPESHM